MARWWFFLVLLNSSSFSATLLSISCLTWRSQDPIGALHGRRCPTGPCFPLLHRREQQLSVRRCQSYAPFHSSSSLVCLELNPTL